MSQFESGSFKILLTQVKLVDRNFGSVIGNPKPFAAPPIVRPTPASYDGGMWPYRKQLELAQRHSIVFQKIQRRKDWKVLSQKCIGSLSLPRIQSERFRSVYIMDFCGAVLLLVDDTPAFVAADEERCLENWANTFATISSDSTEQPLARALAYFARASIGSSWQHSTSNHVNYLRRFLQRAREGIGADLPEPFVIKFDGVRVKINPKTLFEWCLDQAKIQLPFFEGPRIREIKSGTATGDIISPEYFLRNGGHPADPDSETLSFYESFGGGCCDRCGMTTKEMGMDHLFTCRPCRLAWYCSETCQAESWKNGHRYHCKKHGCFQKGNLLIIHGLKKRGDLNSSLVINCTDESADGRLSVMLVEAEKTVGLVAIEDKKFSKKKGEPSSLPTTKMIVAADQPTDKIECAASVAFEVETRCLEVSFGQRPDVKKDGLE